MSSRFPTVAELLPSPRIPHRHPADGHQNHYWASQGTHIYVHFIHCRQMFEMMWAAIKVVFVCVWWCFSAGGEVEYEASLSAGVWVSVLTLLTATAVPQAALHSLLLPQHHSGEEEVPAARLEHHLQLQRLWLWGRERFKDKDFCIFLPEKYDPCNINIYIRLQND